ncbi:MAG: hypothetical protein IT196_18540 [Acidimicrobiales bacterium]|nr:hypothetical protein [Acidimicrobiales bacterium]
MPLRVLPESVAPGELDGFTPDHRSPRWLGAVSTLLLLLSAGTVVATVESLWHLIP